MLMSTIRGRSQHALGRLLDALGDPAHRERAALLLLVAFVWESGHSVRDTLIVRVNEIGDLARTAKRLVGGTAA